MKTCEDNFTDREIFWRATKLATFMPSLFNYLQNYLHSAYVRHPVKRSRHNACNGIAMEIPTQSESRESSFIARFRFINNGKNETLAHPTGYLQCFKARQAGEHLVVHFSQPILGQKPVKRKLVT